MRNHFISTLLLLGVYSSVISQTAVSQYSVSAAGFVQNLGQVLDQNRESNTAVKFVFTDGHSFSLQLKDDGFSYQLFKDVPDQQGMSEAGFGNYDPEEEDYIPSTLITHRVDVRLQGANPHAEIQGVDQNEAVFNFYTTGDITKPVLNVPSFSEVVYKNIYPNIDLVFTSPNSEKNSSLEYKWVVRKGGNPSNIRLAYDGATGMTANNDGSLTILTPVGTVGEGKLISFYENDNSPVASSYNVHGSHINYNITNKVDRTLIIDPNIIWSVDYGGENDEFVSEGDLALDSKNNTIITGNTNSTLYIATTGSHQTTFAGGDFDAFVAKMSANGKLTWATYFGGPEKDEGHAVCTDKATAIYLAGITHSATGIATPGSYRPQFWGDTDAFLTKFNNSGTVVWSTYVGGNQEDQINAMVCDQLGNVYFSGYTTSDTGFATDGAYQDSLNSQDVYGGDAVVGEFRTTGIPRWISYLGGPGTDRAHAVCLGNKRELYIQGTCESTTDFAAGNVFQTTYGGGPADAFVAKWDTNGKFYWCSYYGGEGDDHGRGVAVDQNSDLYIIGWTDSDSAMGSPDGIYPKWFEATSNDGSRLSDGYLAKFHSDGTRAWGTYYGGFGRDQMKGVTTDKANGYVYAIGLTSSDEGVSTPGAFQEELAGGSDGMLLKTDVNGNRIWGTYAGGVSTDKFQDIEKDQSGFVYCLLEETGKFPLTPGTNLTTYRGATDAVVIKFAPFDQCYDPYEPDETANTAKKILPYKDSTLYGYTASISGANDQDWFKVKISPGSNNVKIVLTDLTEDYDLHLWNSTGTQLKGASTHTGTADEQIIINNLLAGTYKLEIVHTNTQFDPNNCYRFKLMIKNSAWTRLDGSEEDDQPMGETDLAGNADFMTDHFNVNISSAFAASAEISLFNAFAQPLYITHSQLSVGSQRVEIPASDLPSGIYFIRVKTELNNNLVLKVAIFH